MNVPANWYPDPSAPGLVRWWDGARWTEHAAVAAPPPQQAPLRPAPEQAVSAPVRQSRSTAVVLWILGIVFVILMILGLVLLFIVISVAIPAIGDFYETWQGVYCGETQQCD